MNGPGTPFVDEVLDVRELEASLEPRATELLAESPFLRAFEYMSYREDNSGIADDEWDEYAPRTPAGLEHQAAPNRRGLTRPDVSWAADSESPDHRHLMPHSFSNQPFNLTPVTLEKLCSLNSFPLPTETEHRVLFGLRACTLVGAALSSDWSTSAELVEATPDHRRALCVLGVWDRQSSLVRVFKGSTVPTWEGMLDHLDGPASARGTDCNLLPTGFYLYSIGVHQRSDPKLRIPGVFRQARSAVVLRTRSAPVYTVRGEWAHGSVGDNIHPARRLGVDEFRSLGCQTIPGNYHPSRGHSGEWATFREAAGLTRRDAQPQDDGRNFWYALFTGREARIVSNVRLDSELPRRLRFGSVGTGVEALQLGLKAAGHYPKQQRADGAMGVTTTRAYIAWQKSIDGGRADAIVTPDDARALGFDLIRQQSVAPIPIRRRGLPAYQPALISPARATAPTASRPTSRAKFVLTGSVGQDGKNDAGDVVTLKRRLLSLGYSWLEDTGRVDKGTVHAIRLFQSIIAGSQTLRGDGRVDVPGFTYSWLQAENAPRWQMMPPGSDSQGFENIELRQTTDHHDYGTSWLASAIQAAGVHFQRQYRDVTSPRPALLTINDASLPQGGDTPDHAGHETGLSCDIRLPRMDGTAPGNTTHRDTRYYDQHAARAILQSLQAQGEQGVAAILFNDTVLIGEGLCTYGRGHDDHVHFQIRPPPRGGVETSPKALLGSMASEFANSAEDDGTDHDEFVAANKPESIVCEDQHDGEPW